MSYDEMSIREFELPIAASNAILRWKPDATFGDVRLAFEKDDNSLTATMRSRDRREIKEMLWRYEEPEHANICEMDVDELLSHISEADDLDVKAVLRWLVERAR